MISTVLIISGDKFQGTSLSQYIQTELGCLCEQREFQECVDIQEESSKYKALKLWDYLGNTVDYYWWVNKQINWGESETSFFAVYNLPVDAEIEDELIDCGVHGIFYEGQDREMIKKGIDTILGGELWYSRKAMTNYIKNKFKKNGQKTNKSKSKSKPNLLTSREEEILALIAAGKTNLEIAESLFISPSTVKTHIYNLFQKIHVQNRVQAAIWAAGKVSN